jgi:hypothetical protein
MIPFSKTPEAARILGVSYHRLIGLLRFHKITPPVRDTSGDYLWGEGDLERARLALRLDRHTQEVPSSAP